MSLESVKRINSLKSGIESTTGEQYTNLTEAIQDLKDGYGSGSSGKYAGIQILAVADDEGTLLKGLLPTVVDARSLDGLRLRSDRMVYKLFDNASSNKDGGMFAYLREAYMPSEPTALHYTFANCARLEKVHGNLENVDSITGGFDNCISITEIPYMPKLANLGAHAFRNCSSLETFNFYTQAKTMNANAFNGCENLTDIYVPWSEGEVANAPWSAPNATIHYNTTYDENHNPIVEG